MSYKVMIGAYDAEALRDCSQFIQNSDALERLRRDGCHCIGSLSRRRDGSTQQQPFASWHEMLRLRVKSARRWEDSTGASGCEGA